MAPGDLTPTTWGSATKMLTDCNIKTTSNVYTTDDLYTLMKDPNNTDIHNPVLRYLEEA